MSLDLPASVERDIQQYAQAEHISPGEAAIKLIQEALKAKKRQASKSQLTDADWNKLQEIDPGFAFFENLPDVVVEHIAKASKRTRSEKLPRRA